MGDEVDTRPPDVITRAMERVYVSMTDADSEGGRLALVESVQTLESCANRRFDCLQPPSRSLGGAAP
jgi:hypothetical protein